MIGLIAVCPRCGNEFHNSRPNKCFCSERCRRRAEKSRWKKRKRGRFVEFRQHGCCPICQKRIIGGRKHRKYCSNTCVQRAYFFRHCEDKSWLEAFRKKRASRKRKNPYDPKKYDPDKARKYYLENRSKILARSRNYRQKHPERCKELYRMWSIKNPDRVRFWSNQYRERNKDLIQKRMKAHRDNLSDSYVKQVIVIEEHVKRIEIPPRILELKRNQLRLLRAVRNRRKEVELCTQEK